MAISSMRASADVAKDKPVATPAIPEDKSVALRARVRAAIDESGWKYDAVARAMSATSGRSIDGPYLAKMLSGEKSFPLDLVSALPDDIERIYVRLHGEALGQIVVTPPEDDSAELHVTVVRRLHARQLPAKVERMAQASLASTRRKAVGE